MGKKERIANPSFNSSSNKTRQTLERIKQTLGKQKKQVNASNGSRKHSTRWMSSHKQKAGIAPSRNKDRRIVTFKDIRKNMKLWNCTLECYVERIYPRITYNTKTGKTRPLYKFLLSDGSQCIEAVCYDDKNGKKISEKLEKNKSYKISGQISTARRNTYYASESDLDTQLELGYVQIVTCKNSMKPCRFVSIKKLNMLMAEKMFFMKEVRSVVLKEGIVYSYLGCKTCFAMIADSNNKGAQYFCQSKSKKCYESRNEPRERKWLLIFHSIKISENGGKDSTEDLVMYHDACQEILQHYQSILKWDINNPLSLKKLIGGTMDLLINGYTDDDGRWKLKIVCADNVLIHQDEEDNDDNGQHADTPRTFEDPAPEISRQNFKDLCVSDKPQQETSTITTYPTSKEHKGLIFFVNIENIQNEDGTITKRAGSEVDWKNVKRLEDLGYKFFRGGNIESYGLGPRIDNFKKELLKRNYSSLIVIISTHGHYNGLMMSDGKVVNLWSDVVYKFHDQAFPGFRNKPKIFIVNACQKFHKFTPEIAEFEGSTRDIIVLYSCMPGYPSLRDPSDGGQGSWFIYFLIETIGEYHKHLDLFQIMRKVQEKQDKRSMEQNAGKYQCGTSVDSLFNKFFF